MIVLIFILTCLFLALTLLYVTMGDQPRRFKFSYYIALFQVALAVFVGIAAMLSPTSPITCLPGFAGVYLNPIVTLVDTISLLTLLPTAMRTRSKKIVALYLAFVLTRLAIHVLAGSAHYWVITFCTL